MGKIGSISPGVSVPGESEFLVHLLCVQKPCPPPAPPPASEAEQAGPQGYFLHSPSLPGEGLPTSPQSCRGEKQQDDFAPRWLEEPRKEVNTGGSNTCSPAWEDDE